MGRTFSGGTETPAHGVAAARRSAAGYRLGQALWAVAAHLWPPDDDLARSYLSSGLLPLYERMSAADRRHALDVHARLVAAGCDDSLLLETALLHDVGKAGSGIGLAHRAVHVLLVGRWPRLWRWLAGHPGRWRQPLWALEHHAALGADRVAARGAPPEMVALVRYHGGAAPADWAGTRQADRHAALQAADAAC